MIQPMAGPSSPDYPLKLVGLNPNQLLDEFITPYL